MYLWWRTAPTYSASLTVYVATVLPIFTGQRCRFGQLLQIFGSKWALIFPVFSLRSWSLGCWLLGHSLMVNSFVSSSIVMSKSLASNGRSSSSYDSNDCERPAVGPSSSIPFSFESKIVFPFTKPASPYCWSGLNSFSINRSCILGCSFESACVDSSSWASVINWTLFSGSHVSVTNALSPVTCWWTFRV